MFLACYVPCEVKVCLLLCMVGVLRERIYPKKIILTLGQCVSHVVGPGSSLGWGHCVVLWDKTHDSLRSGVKVSTSELST